MTEEQKSLSQIRRADRAKDDDWTASFLSEAAFGTVAMLREERPFQNTNTFVYDKDQHAIFFHGARDGATRGSIEGGEKVCFSACRMGRMLPAKNAMNMSVEFESAVVFGDCSVVDDIKEARKALQMLIDKYFSHLEAGKDYSHMTDKEIGMTSVYRIKISEWSGKEKLAEPDFPGAFNYDK